MAPEAAGPEVVRLPAQPASLRLVFILQSEFRISPVRFPTIFSGLTFRKYFRKVDRQNDKRLIVERLTLVSFRVPNSAFPHVRFPTISSSFAFGKYFPKAVRQNDGRLSVLRLSKAQARRLCYGSLKSHRVFSHELIGKSLVEIFPQATLECFSQSRHR